MFLWRNKKNVTPYLELRDDGIVPEQTAAGSLICLGPVCSGMSVQIFRVSMGYLIPESLYKTILDIRRLKVNPKCVVS